MSCNRCDCMDRGINAFFKENCTEVGHYFDCLVGEEGNYVKCMRCNQPVLIRDYYRPFTGILSNDN